MKLRMAAFRGVNQPFEISFNPRNHLSIVYGENGSGKTTVSDALEFVFHGTAGSLEEKSLDGKPRISALVHVQREKADLSVTWEDGQKSRRATIDRTKARITGDTSTILHTLSRKNITRLVEETPTKRFERIQEFVSVPALDEEEARLRIFISDQKSLRESLVRDAEQVEEGLDRIFQETTAEETPKPTRDNWIKDVLQDSKETIRENLSAFEDLHHEITRLRDDFKPLKTAYSTLENAVEQRKAEEERLTRLVAESSDDFAEALDTLEQARLLFLKKEIDRCPVCDTPFTHQELSDKVSEKLGRLKAVTTQSTSTRKAQRAAEQAATALQTHQSNFFAIIEKLRRIHQSIAEQDEWILPPLIPAVLAPAEAAALTADWFRGLAKEAAQLKPLSDFVEKERDTLLRQQALQKQLRDILARRKDTRKEHKALMLMIEKAERIATIFREHRIQHANSTLKAISGDFAQLYASIHPGEGIETIRLYLHPTQKNAARFDGTLFGAENMTPVACLSESHLDTLGLCLFLALQKRENPKNTILYLDDAIASVDEAHMERLYSLIVREAENFKHVIITSSYQPLRFKFRWGILTQRKVEFIELGQWSITDGIALAKGPNSEVRFLRKYLEEGEDASTIANKSGLVLERLLDFLTGIYQCRLPRNPGAEQRWTLDNYKTGLKSEKKLLAALRCDHIDAEGKVTQSHKLAPLLEDVFQRLQFRNAIGCHYKELAGQFDEIGEAVKIGEATMALVAAICDENDELPENQKDGNSWTNRGIVSRRLYPLLKPS